MQHLESAGAFHFNFCTVRIGKWYHFFRYLLPVGINCASLVYPGILAQPCSLLFSVASPFVDFAHPERGDHLHALIKTINQR